MFDELINKLKNDTYITLETTPGHSPVFTPIIDKIADLGLDKLVDGFSTTDNPLAKLKYNALFAAKMLQDRFNKPVIATMARRDRNKIALQSDLLGANEVDIRAILALTGDPATISDQPHAKGVFEGDSSLLLDIISAFNSGMNYAGKPLAVKPKQLYPFAVVNAYAKNPKTLQKKMQKKIDALSNHVIICGYGRNGKQAAKKLLDHKRSFVIIEANKETFDKHQGDEIPFIHGNANEDEVLLQAGVERADCLISALPSDSDNVFVVLSARQINKNIRIISRASQETTYGKLKLAGANNVILPDKIGGDHMASLVVVPDLLEFIDNLSIVGETNINIEEIAIEHLYDTSEIKTIRNLDLRKKNRCKVICYKKEKREC